MPTIMETQCVIFSQRAFNAIVAETLSQDPLETGGILVGCVKDGAWVVIEMVSPGIYTKNSSVYFEYDVDFVNYMANVVASQYKTKLSVLGLWHRHPGNMDIFSPTDDETNLKFAQTPVGAISGLVNCDPKMRFTMYHVSPKGEYTRIPWLLDKGDIIPPTYTELRFTDADNMPIPQPMKQ